MNDDLFLGVDPGKSGSMVAVSAKGEFHSISLAIDIDRQAGMLSAIAHRIVNATLEKVHSSPQIGVVSAFSFGQSFGRCEALLSAFELTFNYVSPQRWQRDMNCLTGGDKNITKALAQELVGEKIRITHRTADATILAHYSMSTYK